MNIDFSDLDKLFNEAAASADIKLEAAMGKACAKVERTAKQLAPKQTGALRNSIQSEVTRENGKVVGYVFTPLEYAPYVEYGTGLFAEGGNGREDVPWRYQDAAGIWYSTCGQAPHPFLRTALTQNKYQIKQLFKEALKK